MDKLSDKNDNADCCLIKKDILKPNHLPNNNNINGKHCQEVEIPNTTNITSYRRVSVSGNGAAIVSTTAKCLENGIMDLHHHLSNHCSPTDFHTHLHGSDVRQRLSLTNTTDDPCNQLMESENVKSSTEVLITSLKFEDDTDEDSNCSNPSTSTDNLSFISESDLTNDIVVIPNLISEDEVSINSNDCVYAYRGRDADSMANEIHSRFDQEDETDFLEMDFDPDPASEIEIYSDMEPNNGKRSILGEGGHRKCHGINGHPNDDDDIKIPREIDKIAEVVELNNSRSRDGQENTVINNTTKASNQRLELLNERDADSVVPVAAVCPKDKQPEKYTGTKPKIKTQRSKGSKSIDSSSSTNILDGGNGRSLNELSSTIFDSNAVVVEGSKFYGDKFFWPSSSSSTAALKDPLLSNPCKKCKFNSGLNPCSHESINLDIKPCCSYLINHSDDGNLLFSGKTQSNRSDATAKMDDDKNLKLVPFTETIMPEPKFVNIQTVSCGKKEIIEALASIDIVPNTEILCEYFENNNNTKSMSIPEYIVHVAKLNCDYKSLINVIKRACPINCMAIDFYPDLKSDIEAVTIPVGDIVSRWTRTTDLRQIFRIRNKRFRTMNILGKLANIIREFVDQDPEMYVNRTIIIPQYYQSGYILITKL